MESDQRYYWRRASEELYAAARAVTPAAELRRRQLAETYVRKLQAIAPGMLEKMQPGVDGSNAHIAEQLKLLAQRLPEALDA